MPLRLRVRKLKPGYWSVDEYDEGQRKWQEIAYSWARSKARVKMREIRRARDAATGRSAPPGGQG